MTPIADIGPEHEMENDDRALLELESGIFDEKPAEATEVEEAAEKAEKPEDQGTTLAREVAQQFEGINEQLRKIAETFERGPARAEAKEAVEKRDSDYFQEIIDDEDSTPREKMLAQGMLKALGKLEQIEQTEQAREAREIAARAEEFERRVGQQRVALEKGYHLSKVELDRAEEEWAKRAERDPVYYRLTFKEALTRMVGEEALESRRKAPDASKPSNGARPRSAAAPENGGIIPNAATGSPAETSRWAPPKENRPRGPELEDARRAAAKKLGLE